MLPFAKVAAIHDGKNELKGIAHYNSVGNGRSHSQKTTRMKDFSTRLSSSRVDGALGKSMFGFELKGQVKPMKKNYKEKTQQISVVSSAPEEVVEPCDGESDLFGIVRAPSGEESIRNGGMKRAVEIALHKEELLQARKALGKNFWSESSARSRASKRSEVVKVAKAVACSERIFPLQKEVIEGVAAALRAAGLKSADQYLNELKLMHVELGHMIPPWVSRCLWLCEKAALRNKGPTKHAMELNPREFTEKTWEVIAVEPELLSKPCEAYVWACVWMLRGIEARACNWEDVVTEEKSKTVTLKVPKSKMDQRACGVKRTLRCCGERPCSNTCVWKVWKKLCAARPENTQRGDPMFVDKKGMRITKSNMILSWKRLGEEGVSGQSGRRSGAMAYVRMGLPIQELAFLGRWKSNVVFTYAEQALQTTPANETLIRHGRSR